ncbi:regulatory protein RecX [Venenivibrio stagnispumantis]|uniref:Regulatory protein RecX n=1 Tax=Venenivibrio stagnispumantis TaxID=407998 RepID=A0AA45WK55_9AQUI|nr:regulatory protein RecX [Venenivibrio stagnispumantis]MCW4573530.1 recombination regulator RecX [Venenivibrio stagnispumantis]SMP06068.1 regulatory protein [Venenivibrio stagnispumantis]
MNIKKYAIILLSKRDYFEKELKEKLYKKGYSKEEIDNVIKELKEEGYINDEKLLNRYKELSLQKGYSTLKLKKKLYQKTEITQNLSEEEELLSALNLLEKSFKKEKNFINVVKFLKNRGFSWNTIQKAVKKFLDGE